ncbi:MAG: ABC transporter permease subunit [Planctomycetota bacterium]
MIRQPITSRTRLLLGVGSVVALLVAYTLLSMWQQQVNPDSRTIPGWFAIAEAVQRAASPAPISGDIILIQDTLATFGRLLAGLAVAVASALVIGIAMGCFTPVEALLAPPLAFLAKIPPTAMLAVFFVIVGVGGSGFYIAMIAFGVTPTLAQAVYLSARDDVPRELLDKASTLGASPVELILAVVLRQVAPRLIEAVRLQVGPAMVYLIAAEYVVADVGYGYRLRIEARKINFDLVYFYLAVLGVVGLLTDLALTQLRRTLCPWFSRTA